MEIRNNADSLKTLLGIDPTERGRTTAAQMHDSSAVPVLSGDHANVSTAGAAVSQAARDSDIRSEKVAAIQAALAAGTYSVPASAVAGKLIDTMIAGGTQK